MTDDYLPTSCYTLLPTETENIINTLMSIELCTVNCVLLLIITSHTYNDVF